MEIYLIRHAIAENRDATRWPDDSIRPLTREGSERFVRAAHGLRLLVPTVDLMLSSTYVRAWQTAQILHDEAGWPPPVPCDALAAHRSSDAALETLREPSRAGAVGLIGHEPNLSLLASLLLAGDTAAVQFELKKGAVISLACNDGLSPGGAVLRWSVSPKILRAVFAERE